MRRRRRTTSASTTCRGMTGDHSIYPTLQKMIEGEIKGFFVDGREPGRGRRERRAARHGAGQPEVAGGAGPGRGRDGVVLVRQPARSRPASCAPRTSRPRSSSCPPRRTSRRRAPSRTRSGCCSGTTGGRAAGGLPQRAVVHVPPRPQGPARSWPTPRSRATARCSISPGTTRRRARTTSPTPRRCCAEINGCDGPTAARSGATTDLKDDGIDRLRLLDLLPAATTDERNQTARRKPDAEQDWVAPEWGWAWPANRRILYNRASADPDGKPWSERKSTSGGTPSRASGPATTRPTSRPTSRPTTCPPEDADGTEAHARGRRRSSCRPTARAGCSRRPG